MFGRKQKGGVDLSASVLRFADLHRECFSRVKHLKLLLDSLSLQEKRQLMEEYSFETFHLVDELLLSCDVSSSTQGAIEAESGLWTLEQLLCLAPQLVGSGWQKHAIESLLKKAIYPHNVLSVRKIAIRLFLIFYQCLAVYGNKSEDLDRVFQCLLPYFPLRGGENTQMILQEYCQSAGSWDSSSTRSNRSSRIIPREGTNNAREKAQLLQVYLDKLLEYCCRETMRIEWDNEDKRRECAEFILERVINLYIKETFPDIDTNGVDIYGGWMGGENESTPLDTADPIVIARYWLIRWMNNVASSPQLTQEIGHGGLRLYHSVLFSSQQATNCLLTLLGEGMKLPLACANVIRKIVSLLSSWLIQSQIAPFVSNGSVSIESSSLLFIHILLSFFHSPYLDNSDRLDSSVSISFDILGSFRSLSSSSSSLSLPSAVWNDLLLRLISCATRLSVLSHHFSHETSAAFANTILTLLITATGLRDVKVDDSVWEAFHAYLDGSIWLDSTIQWTNFVRILTRTIIYYAIDVDVEVEKKGTNEKPLMSVRRLRERAIKSEGGIMESQSDTSCEDEDNRDNGDTNEVEDNVFLDSDEISPILMRQKGDIMDWLSIWRRLILSCSLSSSPSGKMAISTLSTTASSLFSVGIHHPSLWIIELIMCKKGELVINESLPCIVESLSSPLISPTLQSICLSSIIPLVNWKDSSVLSSILCLRPLHLLLVTSNLINTLPPRSINEPSDELIRVICQLALHSHSAEGWIMRQLAGSTLTLTQGQLCTNAIIMVSIIRGDVSLLSRLAAAILSWKNETRWSLIYLLSSSLPILNRSIDEIALISIISNIMTCIQNEKVRKEMESVAVSLLLSSNIPPTPHQLSSIIHQLLMDKDRVSEGSLLLHSSQFPLPSFSVSRFNSTLSTNESIFITRHSSLISVNGSNGRIISNRSRFSRHSWTFDPLPSLNSQSKSVSSWLAKCSTKKKDETQSTILGAMGDRLDQLVGPSREKYTSNQLDATSFQQIIMNTKRKYRRREKMKRSEHGRCEKNKNGNGLEEWRSMAASVGFIYDVVETRSSFTRNTKHLDQTLSRETHKIAVVYVGSGQEDKLSIFSNTRGSDAFETFVRGLGWEIITGNEEGAYNGGLPSQSRAIYYSDPLNEAIFHLSTRLQGDVPNKMKHIGNDEVHVVWNENRRRYKRETLATQFCDVLFTIDRVSPSSLRISIETQSLMDLSPLWNGIVIPEGEAPILIRNACLNASRAYRLSKDTIRPLSHRNTVFEEECYQLKRLSLNESISKLFLPIMTECS
uniref:Rap-GAP domain-containing protein n=1 Tax=Pristionchus pacificus TaxID=54126 RepID=A0A8R1Z3W2_PRIPA